MKTDAFHCDLTQPCDEWVGLRDDKGYGIQKRHGQRRNFFTHRTAFLEAYGYEPPVVRHGCHNPPCRNPDHLMAGTQLDNIADTVGAGRHARGEGHGRAKLTKDQVAEIRERLRLGAVGASLAKEFGVANTTISKIRLGRRWRDV